MNKEKRFRWNHGTTNQPRTGFVCDVELKRAFQKKCRREGMGISDRLRLLMAKDIENERSK